MAKQTEKTKATGTKKAKAEVIEQTEPQNIEKNEDIKEKLENNEETTDVIETTDVEFNEEQFEESLKNLDMTIKDSQIDEEIKEKIDDKISDIEKLSQNIKDLENSKTVLNNAIEQNPDNAKSLIDAEIKKTEALKKQAEQKISSLKSSKTNTITGWWNGMGYDM